MSESCSSSKLTAADIAGVARMQMRRDIDSYRARAFWQKALADADHAAVVEGLVLALSGPAPVTQTVTLNVHVSPGVDAAEVGRQVAHMLDVQGVC